MFPTVHDESWTFCAKGMISMNDMTPNSMTMSRLSFLKRLALFAIPMALLGLAWGGPTNYFASLREKLNPKPAETVDVSHDGARLFTQNCAYCHGERGDGQGIASLSTPARYFGAEPYKFTTTTGTRIPTDDNLLATLKRGIVGSSMPSFAHLSDGELRAIVSHLRVLTRRGKYEQLLRKAQKEADAGGDEPDYVVLASKADELCRVGTPLEIPKSFRPSDSASLARGKAIFMQQCANCHGPEGLGNGQQAKELKHDSGYPVPPRNLVGGVFKGGGEKPDLYTRIKLGIPGTPMPAGEAIKPDEFDDLINYVLSLSHKS
jgi:mono/diheme cytochrome c family protein